MSYTLITAELGINANGSLKIAKDLIFEALDAGCDAVKLQKRNIDLVYSPQELDAPRESPFGKTNRALKEALEFNKQQYDEIDRYCEELGIDWYASAWDLESQQFLRRYDCVYNKVASALLTHKELLEMVAEEGKYTFISTGMSTLEQIERAVEVFEKEKCRYELLHTNSSYPMKAEDANLMMIPELRKHFGCRVGYSGHETGIIISCAAVALGATSIERHITLDRASWGSDQSASLEIPGLKKMVQYIRTIEVALGSGVKVITEKEKEIAKKLRKVDTL